MRARIEREMAEELERSRGAVVSMCAMTIGPENYGIEAAKVHEVLGACAIQRVPLAPAFIAGVISNRGEVLTMVDLRVLLGREKRSGGSAVLVLEDGDEGERFGLVVDAAIGLVTVACGSLETNPSTLNARSKALFDGAYKLPTGLMVRLDTTKLRPSRLQEMSVFKRVAKPVENTTSSE